MTEAGPTRADHQDGGAVRSSTRHASLVLLLFIGLAVLHTWPLASGLGSLSRHDNGDAALNEWAIAWVAHQLPRDPWHLFDANIFYPEPNTLAFSEHLFVQGIMGAPLIWLGVPTLVVHNVLILAGFALTGWTMALVLRRRTGSWACGVLAGMLLAFNSHNLARIAHLQAVHVQFMPLALYALDRLLTRPKAVNAVRLAALYALQGLTSNYLLVFMTFGLAGAGLSRVNEWVGPRRWRVFALVCLAGALAIVMLAPFLIHYFQAQRDQGLTRSLSETSMYAASWEDYLSAVGNVHYRTWSAPLWRGEGIPLFPGIVALLLTAVALVTGFAVRDRFARIWLALGLVGLLLSFGTSLPGYAFLYYGMPMLQGIRASVRFGYLVLAGIAALAAFGLMLLRTRLETRPRARAAVTAASLVLVTAEVLRIPVGYREPNIIPAAYSVLKDHAGAVLLELPLPDRRDFQANAAYMLNSTLHWRPMVNGYSGFAPRSYQVHVENLRGFPDPHSLAYLRRIGVTHVSVHASGFRDAAGQERLQAIASTAQLQPAIKTPSLTIYTLSAVGR